MKKETNMNSIVKSGEVMKLKDLISYEEEVLQILTL